MIEIQPPVRVTKKPFEDLAGEGPIRRFLREWTPILPRPKLFGSIYASGLGEVDKDVEKIIEAKKEEWRRRGYREGMIRMAEELAREWAMKMSEAFAPPHVRDVVFKYNIEKGLEVADRWIARMHGSAVRQSTLT